MVKEEVIYLGEILGRLQQAVETLNYSYGKCQAIGAKGTYYLGLNLGNILIIACKDQGYFRKCPWDWVLPNKMSHKWVSYLGIERYHYCGQSSNL